MEATFTEVHSRKLRQGSHIAQRTDRVLSRFQIQTGKHSEKPAVNSFGTLSWGGDALALKKQTKT